MLKLYKIQKHGKRHVDISDCKHFGMNIQILIFWMKLT